MILKELKLWNFRKFKANGAEPGLVVEFHKGLNALVGENDAGKSAIIDAIKLVLQTQSGEYVRVTEDDFYTAGKDVASEFRVECLFTDFDTNEAKNFVEYLSIEKLPDGKAAYLLKLRLRMRRENGRFIPELRAGDGEDGLALEGKARELLKCVYLKPLRDAAKEMRSGRNSRISQILYNHPAFDNKTDHALVKIFEDANLKISDYFENDAEGKLVLSNLRSTLLKFASQQNPIDAELATSEMQLKPILESLSLLVSETQPGLGVSNQLFIAAELLLLHVRNDGSLRLALIEELEAHLHPQAQLRLIEHLQQIYDNAGVQIIVSTHSPTLASRVNLKNIILVRDNAAYDLAPDKTMLAKGDYLFLQRFLDTTKANLFFARSVLMVEGDAENLVFPVIAEILGLDLDKYGVSIVKIGGLAFRRYAKIFCRQNSPAIPIRVAIVTDCDVKTEKLPNGTIDSKDEATEAAIKKLKDVHDYGPIRTYVAPHWTFEYSIAMSCLGPLLHKSILEAKKISNSDEYPLTREKMNKVESEAAADPDAQCTDHPFAYHVYKTLMLDGEVSKSITAQCLAAELRKSFVEGRQLEGDEMFDADLFQLRIDDAKRNDLKTKIESDTNLKYIVEAIKYVTGTGG